jgi:hypothetical protein
MAPAPGLRCVSADRPTAATGVCGFKADQLAATDRGPAPLHRQSPGILSSSRASQAGFIRGGGFSPARFRGSIPLPDASTPTIVVPLRVVGLQED